MGYEEWHSTDDYYHYCTLIGYYNYNQSKIIKYNQKLLQTQENNDNTHKNQENTNTLLNAYINENNNEKETNKIENTIKPSVSPMLLQEERPGKPLCKLI